MSMGVFSDGQISHQFLDELPEDLVLSLEQRRQLKLLLRALCLIARDVALPGALLESVARLREGWIADQKKHQPEPEENHDGMDGLLDLEEERGVLLHNFESSLEHSKYVSAARLRRSEESRFYGRLKRRLKELGSLSSEEMQPSSKIELNTLKLLGLQRKVRFEVATELRLKQTCNRVETHLVDWGLMRLRYHLSSFLGGYTGSAYSGSDEQMRKKREDERQRRLEQAEQDRIQTRKRKFFSELMNFGREFLLQGQQIVKLQKQRNDGIINWHAKQKQRATRAERLRYQALRADDQEAYMRMVEESKNERLTTLLSKTDDLLQRLGAMVQEQKDTDPVEAFNKRDKHKDRNRDVTKDPSSLSSPKSKPESGKGDVDTKKRDYLEGQRQYNSAVHQIEEQVTEQPAMLEGGQLRIYQIEGLQWMLSLYNNNLNGILADEMGLGKTIQTIALFAYLIENKGLNGPHIIVAPKAVLPNWAHEFSTWVPSVSVVMYDGRAEDRRILREQHAGEGSFNVLITHYDLIMRDKQFLKKIRWHYMVVDEGHRLKNHDCMLARTLSAGYHIRRRLLLTGTPIQNSLQELWSLLNFILPAIFNSSGNFEEWFNAPFADRAEVSLTEEEQLLIIRRLHQVLRPFLLRRKKSEVEKFLPTKTQVMLKCDLSAWQKLYYQQMIESRRVGLLTGSGKKQVGLQNTVMQLRKCCNHPYLFLNKDYEPRDRDEIIRASGKFELLDRLLPKLQKTGHRVLLFSQMTRLMDLLEMYLTTRGFTYLRLDGTTKTEDRGKKLQMFNAEDSPYFMFLLSTRAGGLGLNLQTADTVIIFDSDWNPQMDQQAEDRAHRIGQKKEVHVFVLVSVGSIEEEILERAKSKMGIDAKVIQAGLFNTTSTPQERRELLEEIMRKGTSNLSADVPSEREINRLTASSEEEFELFEEMDEERRKDEGYRSRLMEEHEVPEWVFLKTDDIATNNDSTPLEGKRKRKEVIYSDILSDSQWLKAVEDGQDVTEVALSKRTRSSLRELSSTPQTGSRRSGSAGNSSSKGPIVLKVRTRYRETVVKTRYANAKDSESEAPTSSTEDKPESSQQSQDWRKLKRKRSSQQQQQQQHESEEEVEEEEEQEDEEEQEQEEEEEQGEVEEEEVVEEEEDEEDEEEEANPSDSDESYEKKFQNDTGRSTRRNKRQRV
ncbi:probable ATP-dependent DNA helicase CHR12 [Selaginella moellendorffii]|uniref:probable ATP-dependent DNA helicase CHR12 n=1 Tax=Selaginella moellendorffii TaxID=88036 RepID=UPI000D1C59D0|nr:probable ATP-dependent DNA helicase CHR12 [Selaginella moellendorffii]|eukprot:XP_024535558.1 probable ATP-dependent DNA helicase CHR12 [Selaginella moellendorffii]